MTESLDPSLDAALQAHARGFTPTPLRPALKRPILSDWPTLHYADTDALRAAWDVASESYEDQPLNLGLALGAAHGGLVDIDLDHHKALAIASQVLPETAMRSGRPGNPGSHFWYVIDGYDPGIQQFKLPDGTVIIEFRGGGGQTAIPPSLHPDGDEYEWAGEPWGGESGPVHLDAEQGRQLHATVMSIALLVTLADNWPRKGGRHSAYLPLVGGLLRDADEKGNPRCHPLWDANIEHIIRLLVGLTNDADGAGARITEAVHTTRKKIVRGDKVQGWPTLAGIIGEEHVAKAREIIERIEELGGVPRAKVKRKDDWYDEAPGLRVVGDDERAQPETPEDRDLRVALLDDKDRDPLAERLSDWETVDLGPYRRGGIKPPEPGLLFRDDGAGLLYPGRVNSFYGEGGSGKTLLALHTAAEVMNAGGHVLFIDLEDEPHGTLDRLDSLGVSDEVLEECFAYICPQSGPLAQLQVDRWTGESRPTPGGLQNREALLRAIEDNDPALIIIDGTTTIYRIHGFDTNAAVGTDQIGGWLRELTNGNKRTVLLLDHTGKSAGPGSTPMGSQHKIAMIQGVALHVFSANKPRRGQKVTASLYVGKDRPGKVAEVSADLTALQCADVEFDATGETLTISLVAPTAATALSPGKTQDEVAMADALRDHPGVWMSKSALLLAAGLTTLTDRQFKTRIDSLLNANIIEKRGDKFNRQYRFVPSINP